MVKTYSKPKRYYILYTVDDITKRLPISCRSSTEAFDIIFGYLGTLDKSNMSIISSDNIDPSIESMSEQEFLATVRHPVQKKFSKKKINIIHKKNLVYRSEPNG